MEKINNLDINSDNGVLTIFIAVNGDDSWSGLHPDPSAGLDDGPLATLQAAKEKLKLLNGNKNGEGRDTVIYMRGGTYHIRNTVVFSADDWPYTDKTLTIAAY